jgi:hypothetical protein
MFNPMTYVRDKLATRLSLLHAFDAGSQQHAASNLCTRMSDFANYESMTKQGLKK